MDEKDLLIQRLLEEIAILKKIVAEQSVRITELERCLGLNSKNSSKPPSSDGFKKPPTTSLRPKGKNPSGGQKGHEGHTLQQVTNPDKIIRHKLTTCPHCKNTLNNEVIDVTKRQVFDIPPVKVEKICPCCKKEVRAEFPIGVDVPAQYGPRIKAQTVYLAVQHFIPEDRLQTIFQDLYGAEIATATLVKFTKDLANKLDGFCQSILEKIKLAALKHMDETGFRIGGKTTWLHVASNDRFTYYHHSPKRKSLLDGVIGTVVHDHWKPYYQMDTKHALCNAHHLRELKALIEGKEVWSKKMRKLLLFMHKYRQFFPDKIPREKIKRLEKIYAEIIKEGLAYHLKRRKELPCGGKLIRKRYPGHNLLLRLQNYRNDVLRFLHDPIVPFTNNQAEQDIRMMKLKQKISGGFRTPKGADVFVCIRTFLSTARKQQWDIFSALSKCFCPYSQI